MAMTDVLKISDEEIVSWLENVGGFPVGVEMIKNPTPSFVQTVFTSLMTQMQLNLEAMKLPSWSAMQFLKYPEHYDNIPVIIFFSYARQIAQVAGINDFSIMDIIEPKPRRTKRIIYCLLPLWKHVLTKMLKFQEVKSASEEIVKDKEALQQRFLENQEKLKEMPSVNHEELNEALERKAVLEKQFAEMDKEKEEIAREYQATKTAIADKQNKIRDMDVKILSEKERLEELSNGILKSPTRLASEVEELQMKLDEQNNKLHELTKEQKEREQKKKAVKNQCESVEKVVALQREVVTSAESLRKNCASLETLQSEFEGKSEKERNCRALLESTVSSITTLEQKINQLRLKNKSEVDNYQKLNIMLKDDLEKRRKALNTTKEQAHQLRLGKEDLSRDIELQCSKMSKTSSEALASISDGLKLFDLFYEQNVSENAATKKLISRFQADCDAHLQ